MLIYKGRLDDKLLLSCIQLVKASIEQSSRGLFVYAVSVTLKLSLFGHVPPWKNPLKKNSVWLGDPIS